MRNRHPVTTKTFIKFWIDVVKGRLGRAAQGSLVLGRAAQGSLYQTVSSNKLPLGYVYWVMRCFFLGLVQFPTSAEFLLCVWGHWVMDWLIMTCNFLLQKSKSSLTSSGLSPPYFNPFLIFKSCVHMFFFWPLNLGNYGYI